MTTATTRKPTKKAFHFPKSTVPGEEQSEAQMPMANVSTGKTKRSESQAKDAASVNPEVAAPAPTAVGKTKVARAKKQKVIRDSFTMPKADYERIALLKRKCLEAGVAVKKSELLRAGLQMLESASSKRLVAAISALETVKTGRPANSEQDRVPS